MNGNASRLSSSEIASLWMQYLQETSAVCGCKFVLATIKDPEIRSVYQLSLDLSKKHIEEIKAIFQKEDYPIPIGFTDEDVNLNAPPLFTDYFWLEYIYNMTIHGLTGHNLSFSVSIRKDIRDFHYQCNLDAMNVYNKSIDVLLSKGLFDSPPSFTIPDTNEFISDVSYAVDIIGKRRKLNSVECGNIFFNLKKSIVTKAVLLGFMQVAKNKEVRDFMEKGVKLVNKHIRIFSSILHEENLHSPPLLDNQVTNSLISPFSDKFMMAQSGFLFNTAMSYYGTALSTSMRADIIGHCEASIFRDLKMSAICGNIMIKNGWLEKPPEASSRQQLPI
ncbi:DUF3231 family protein [Bacillus methanolicus]|uniref:DUF3231 family protein n=1 Tax=Bacillus methanolicus (strain MGA3 / ATCC 53907) TaxID=796606 RepID=I3DZN8_BACMM|nr:DUF3231 family protein [Bacillus methanolicus]AIE59773.1 hypothetical protein BMMGA3_06735 [Bacillus methanolicus MGA3]EIJ79709.1 hypothetical protein MGA3_15186 [Bacillus methanolicus MGA3]